jgi:hypothetical protein
MSYNLVKSPLHSSLQSAALVASLPGAVISKAQTINHRTKCINKGAAAITQPVKRLKHEVLSVSSQVISDADDDSEDRTSTKTGESVDIIDINSDMDELEKELGMHCLFSYHMLILS